MANGQNKVSGSRATFPSAPGSSAIELATFFYAAIFGNGAATRPPKVSSRIPAMLAKGFDPEEIPPARPGRGEPGLGTRLTQGAWRVARSVDAALSRQLRAQFVNGAHPLCQIEHNSSVAELREAVEAMGLVFTSSLLPDVTQAIDLREGASLSVEPALAQREESAQLHDSLFCVEKSLPRSQLHHLLALIEGIAEQQGREVHYITNDDGLAQCSCMGNAESAPCGKLSFDPCDPGAIHEALLEQSTGYNSSSSQAQGSESTRALAVFIGNGTDIKAIEGSYTEALSRQAQTLITIRGWDRQDPGCDAPDPVPAPGRSSASADILAAVLLSIGIPVAALGLGVGGWRLWRSQRNVEGNSPEQTTTVATEVHFSS